MIKMFYLIQYHSFRMRYRLKIITKTLLTAALGLLILIIMSNACGQKGDLYLPDKKQAANPQ